MINYLLTTTATTTHQPKTDMVNYVNISGAQNINSLKTFGTLPECSNGNPLIDNQLVNKFYVDHLSIHQSRAYQELYVVYQYIKINQIW